MSQSSKEFSANYYDGSGNGYKIRNSELKYEPMTPELSSTGTYSGGAPQLISLNNEHLAQLQSLFEVVLENCSTNKNRIMGTGRLFMNDKVCNIAMRNKAKVEVEKYLKSLLN